MGAARLWSLASLSVVAVVMSIGCGGGGGNPQPLPPEKTPTLNSGWATCDCTDCNGVTATIQVSGCSPGACSAVAADFCQTICTRNGHTACASTTLAACIGSGCESCLTTGTCAESELACFIPQGVCGPTCNQSTLQGCPECKECKLQVGGSLPVCVDPTNMVCSAPSMLASGLLALPETADPATFLDRTLGRVRVALNSSSTLSFNHPDGTGSTTLSSGSATLIVRNCPGPSCGVGLVDLAANANDFEVEITGPNPDVEGLRMRLVRSAVFQVAGNALTLPEFGAELVASFTVDEPDPLGSFSQTNRLLSPSGVTGNLDLAAGLFDLSGVFQLGGADVNLGLHGNVANLPPVAKAGRDQVITCTPASGAAVTLDGSRSTDLPPGAGIASYRWYDNFDVTTATGTFLAEGVNPTVNLAPGLHRISLLAIDGEGSIGIDTVKVLVIADTEPPHLDVEIGNDCLWPPNGKLLRFSIGHGVSVHARDKCAGDVSRSARIVSVDSNQDEDANCRNPGHEPDTFVGDTAFCVRSERCEREHRDRIYTVTVAVVDAVGNEARERVKIVVPFSPEFGPGHNHPFTPDDLEGHGRIKHCGDESPGAFIRENDRRCKFDGTTHLDDDTDALTDDPAAAGEARSMEGAGGCRVGGSPNGDGASFGLVALAAMTLARLRRRRRPLGSDAASPRAETVR